MLPVAICPKDPTATSPFLGAAVLLRRAPALGCLIQGSWNPLRHFSLSMTGTIKEILSLDIACNLPPPLLTWGAQEGTFSSPLRPSNCGINSLEEASGTVLEVPGLKLPPYTGDKNTELYGGRPNARAGAKSELLLGHPRIQGSQS